MINRNEPEPNRSSEESYGRDFDDGANDLWSLYEKEAKKDDEALLKPSKDDMDGVLIFVCKCLFWSTRADVTFPSRLAYFLVFSPHSSSHRFRICE